MSHRRKAKDQRKAERESMDDVDLCIPHITLDITDLLCRGRHIQIPEDIEAADPFVSFNVDEGDVEIGSTLGLVDIFDDGEGDYHYTFAKGNVSVTISRSDMEVILGIGKQA